MTSGRPSTVPQRAAGGRRRLGRLSPRLELTALVLLGAVGAGVVFLAMRQGWAQVRTAVPAPLPTSVVTDSGQSLVPYADALVVAALATLAAVLATRRVARRVTGVLLAGLGVAIVAAVTAGVSASAAVAAAAQNVGPATGSGAGSAPGSATDGTPSSATDVPNVAGFHSHAVLTATGWQALAVAGAVAVIAAGVLVALRAARLPVMSSRYDSPAGVSLAAAPPPAARAGEPAAGPSDDAAGPDSASIWESLSRGEDPTSAARRRA